jgi:hypothetical protein
MLKLLSLLPLIIRDNVFVELHCVFQRFYVDVFINSVHSSQLIFRNRKRQKSVHVFADFAEKPRVSRPQSEIGHGHYFFEHFFNSFLNKRIFLTQLRNY